MKWPNPDIEFGRIRQGKMASTGLDGPNGAFLFRKGKTVLQVIASNGMNWEHVSVTVSGEKREPTWREMCWIKSIFWRDDECVVQYHPPQSSYVNNHPGCLHLWKPLECDIPMPPEICVGVKQFGVLRDRADVAKAQQIINETVTG